MVTRIALVGCIVTFCSVAFSQTATTAPEPASAPAVLPEWGELAEMPGVLNLDAQAVANIREALAAKKEALAKFMKDNGSAWSQAMQDSVGQDAQKSVEGKDGIKKHQALWDALGAQHDGKILSTLTVTQRLTWEEHTLYRQMVLQFSRVEVGHGPGGMTATKTEPGTKSLAIIKDLSAKAAKTLQSQPNPYDAKARAELIQKLKEDLTQRIEAATGGDS